MSAVSAVLNALIFVMSAGILTRYFREDGRWSRRRGLWVLRFFTVLSNTFSGCISLLVLLFGAAGKVPHVLWVLKFDAVVSVLVTLITVFVFLAPTMGGLRPLLARENLYMHLLGPLLAAVALLVFERPCITLPEAMTGVIPMMVYAAVYLFQVVIRGEGAGWEDFYGFNRNGRWVVSLIAMAALVTALSYVMYLLLR